MYYNCFELPLEIFTLFGSVVKKRFGSCIQSIRFLDMIQRIHLRCGSCGSMIRFWILVKKRNVRFGVKNPDSDFTQKKYFPFFKPPQKTFDHPCQLKFGVRTPWAKGPILMYHILHTHTLISTFDNLCSLFRRWS